MKYKNTSKKEQTIIGVGVVKAGKTIKTDKKINNPNFELVKKKTKKKKGKK